MPPRIRSHRDMYIAPSSGHTSFNFNMPFNTDSKEMWGCFLMSGVKILHSYERYGGNPFQFTKTILWLYYLSQSYM